jgi:hypothetical protein
MKKKKQIKKIAVIVDKQSVWKKLKELNGESVLLELSPPFKKNKYVIDNLYKKEITVLKSDKDGNVLSWTSILKTPLEDEGYEII